MVAKEQQVFGAERSEVTGREQQDFEKDRHPAQSLPDSDLQLDTYLHGQQRKNRRDAASMAANTCNLHAAQLQKLISLEPVSFSSISWKIVSLLLEQSVDMHLALDLVLTHQVVLLYVIHLFQY